MIQPPSNHYLCGCRVNIYSKMKHPYKARRGDVRTVDFHVSNSPRNATSSCISHDSATFQYTSFQNAGHSKFLWIKLVSIGKKVSKTRRDSRRWHGFLLRFSEDLTRLSINDVERGYREVRILLDHMETMLEYKKQFKNLEEFNNTDIDYEAVLVAKILDAYENKAKKKTKRAFVQTVTGFKRQAEVVESKID
jgi:hypothetical protein